MNKHLLTKLKISTKRLLGRSVYGYVYVHRKLKNSLLNSVQTSASRKKHQNFIMSSLKRWHIWIVCVLLVLGGYFGIGAAISSKINNRLNIESKIPQKNNLQTLSSLVYVIKTQVDEQAWTPALPIIFPASVLDNLPNFQLGAKESANYFIKKLSTVYNNNNLKEASELLDYSPDIWLFSQTENDKLAPGSAKQYRKALAIIEKTIKKDQLINKAPDKNFIFLLKSADSLLNKKIYELNRHIQEHSSEVLDFKADDIFYNTLGTAYTMHYFISALAKEYQTQILAAEQYEEITSALKFLEEAAELEPAGIKNAAPNDIYAANHLIYIAYYLSQAQNHLQKIYYNTLLKSAEPPHED